MTSNTPTWRAWLVLLVCAAICFALAGAPGTAFADDDDDEFYSERYEDEDELPGGGGHGGAGATHVPIVDDDYLGMFVWTEDQLEAGDAHQHATGVGVTVAVLDGGFNLSHPDIAGNLDPLGYDALELDGDPEDLGNGYDDDGDGYTDYGVGHGTFVASMVLLAAPDATILPIRVRDDEGWGFDSELRRGLQYAWDADARIVVIPGTAEGGASGSVLELIEDMRDDGVTIIVSAGNEGWQHYDPLADSDQTLTVVSSDSNDRLAGFANYSDQSGSPVVFAPGVSLYGALGAPEDDSSGYWSGTSFSAGLVGGAAALMLEWRPTATPNAIQNRLLNTADDAFDAGGSVLSGTGRINLNRALTD